MRYDYGEMIRYENKIMSTIYFYNPSIRYGSFSNFFSSPVDFEGRLYPTSEHAYQAAKFIYPGASNESLVYAELIRAQNTPTKAFYLGRQIVTGSYPWQNKLRDEMKEHSLAVPRADWDEVKVDVMRNILRNKFNQHPSLKSLLLSTGDSKIVEDSGSDYFWGQGKNGSGQNMLGVLLMDLRTELST